MSEEKNKKNIRKTFLLKYLILIGALILALIYIVIPRIMDFRRRMNIKKDLESVYPGCEIVKVECEKKPTYESDLREDAYLFNDAFPEDGLYFFWVLGTEDPHKSDGYATKDGTVVYDSYAALYYKDASVSYFESIVDFEHNFPGLDYYISKKNLNQLTYVQTHECTTFEEYRNATSKNEKLVGFAFARALTCGYPALYVGIVDGNEETVEEIKKILQDADFDMYVQFLRMRANAEGEYDEYCFGESLGKYIPSE